MSTVLLVDDSPADRALFRRMLGDGGHTVHEVSLGTEVLDRIKQVMPHVVVLDVNLPDTDGHEVCRQIRRDPFCSGIPVLMLTVHAQSDDVLRGLSAGADDYIAKDEANEIILARVNRLANYRKLATLTVMNEQLMQMGRLLAGIVHEIRTPLSVIRGHAELMHLVYKDDASIKESVDPILRNAMVLQSRLDHLMTAVRVGPATRSLASARAVVDEAVELFAKSFDPRRTRARVGVSAHFEVAHVEIDAGQLIQVLLNLLANAQEAMHEREGSGKIDITLRKVAAEGADWVVIDVADDGPGISAAVLERIFEPFFTTKENGTGYGLYLAHQLVREQAGSLTVSNGPAGGAVFSIRLPLASEAAVASADE